MKACRACGQLKVRTLEELIAGTPPGKRRVTGKELMTDSAVSMAWNFESQGACSFGCLMQVMQMPPAPDTPQGDA